MSADKFLAVKSLSLFVTIMAVKNSAICFILNYNTLPGPMDKQLCLVNNGHNHSICFTVTRLSIGVLTYNVNKRAKASPTLNGMELLTLIASVTYLLTSHWIRK